MFIKSRVQDRRKEEKLHCNGDPECVLSENMVQNPNFQSLVHLCSCHGHRTERCPERTLLNLTAGQLDVFPWAQVKIVETAEMDSS